jgi:hypothetical protein
VELYQRIGDDVRYPRDAWHHVTPMPEMSAILVFFRRRSKASRRSRSRPVPSMSSMRSVEAHMTTLGMLVAFVLLIMAPLPARAAPDVKKAQCDKGGTIADALKHADPGDTILVSGVCRERVTITTDGITLDGQGSAVVDGGGGGPQDFTAVVTVKGA